MADIGAKIKIDGEKQFKQELSNLTQQGKTLSAQMGELASSFEKADDKEKVLGKASENLSKQIENQQKIVDKLSEAVQKSADAKGADSTETLKLQEKLAKAQTVLNKMQGTTAETAVGMDKLGKEEKEVSKQTSTASEKISAMTVALGNLAADAIKSGIKAIGDGVKKIAQYFVDAVKGAASFADEILTLAAQTNMSTESLQEYKYMASLTDVELSTITGSMTKLTKTMSSAKGGTGAAAGAFKKLGVSVTDENGNLRDANSVFGEAIDALGGIQNETERDALAMEIFGKSAKDLNPLIKAGSDQLDAFRQEAHDVGYVLDNETLESMSEVQDGFDRLGLAADSAKNQIGAAIGQFILPYLNDLVSAVQNLLKTGDVDAFIESISGSLNDLLKELSRVLPKALKAGSMIIGEILMGITSMLPEIGRAALDLVFEFARFILDNLPTVVETAAVLLIELANGLSEHAPTLIPAVITCILEIVNCLLSHIGDIISAAISLIDGLVQGLTSPEAIDMLIGSIPTLISSLLSGILSNLGQIIRAGINIAVNLGVGLIRAIPELVAMIPQVISAIWDAITEIDWLQLGGEIISGIADGIGKTATAIWEAVKNAFNTAIEWIKNLGKQAWQWGKDMIQGFIDGIKAWASHLWDSAKEIGKGIAKFLHFSRPDVGPLRDYEQWMPDFMKGLAKGIDANAWRVQDALANATGGMTLSGKTQNIDYGGVAINVYAAQGQDVNAIARQVMAAMQNEYNAKKAVFA